MSNFAQLTHSHKAIAAKKRAKRDQIKEVLFDDEARRDFLTGFHKRKLAKSEAARAKAKEREKQERLELRREKRRTLRERALENAAQVEQAYGAVIPDDAEVEWSGIQHDTQRDEEYEDEETLAIVTVVEDFDPDTIIHGPSKPRIDTPPKPSLPMTPSLPLLSKNLHNSSHRDLKNKKISYETKDARKKERAKQRARRAEKAELAGGKAARKHKSSHGPKRKGGSKR